MLNEFFSSPYHRELWMRATQVLSRFLMTEKTFTMMKEKGVWFGMQPILNDEDAMAFPRGKPKALLHHSDQGSQYSGEEFQRLLAEQNITCSMSRRGDCWDNAAMESFVSTLKLERRFGS